MDSFVLENDTLKLEFDRKNGALVRLTSMETGWPILDRPNLGLSFRLLVPIEDAFTSTFKSRRNNQVLGERQKLTSLDIVEDGKCAVLVWDGVESEHAGKLAIKLVLKVQLSARQAVFSMKIENKSEHTIENVFCPYLGDVHHPAGEHSFTTFSYYYASGITMYLWPFFSNTRGYYGFDYPTLMYEQESSGPPMAPFLLLQSDDKQGLYVGVVEPSAEPVAWHFELRPGYRTLMDARVPDTLSIAGKDVATRFSAVHVPFIRPGEERSLTPVALEAYKGNWQKGADIYKKWRAGWMKTPKTPEWAANPHSWQQIHINSPEDELRMKFKDLVEIGRDCARHGVKAIQLVGWNDGGQDQGNPSHDPDPRLGTFEELKEAIAEIQKLGVKVVLFAKFTWSDRATERFRNDLIRLAIKDPYGDYHVYRGYQYQTVTQGLDINTKRLVPMCFLSEEYLRLCDVEFRKMVELGADGILFDECEHHGSATLCFDEEHGHRYGAPVYANDRKLIDNFRQIVKDIKPGFLFAGEACYDWEFEAYHLSYHRSNNRAHVPLTRYLLPHVPLMTAVTGFDDRSMVNQCLLCRYIISYEPYNFKGRLDDFPATVEYGKKMDALRTELRDYFWDGEFQHEVGGVVSNAKGERHYPYSIFRNLKNGKFGMVICNYDETNSVTVKAVLDDGTELERYRLVDDPAWKDARDGIEIPALSAAVVI